MANIALLILAEATIDQSGQPDFADFIGTRPERRVVHAAGSAVEVLLSLCR
jgi:hypothetical protein